MKTFLASLFILGALLPSVHGAEEEPTKKEEKKKKQGTKGIVKLTDSTEPEDSYSRYEWSIVSFYTNDEESKSIDALMEGAKRVVDQKVKDGIWHER